MFEKTQFTWVTKSIAFSNFEAIFDKDISSAAISRQRLHNAGSACDPLAEQDDHVEENSLSNQPAAQAAFSSSRSNASSLPEIQPATVSVTRVDPNDSAPIKAVSKLAIFTSTDVEHPIAD